MPRYNVLSPIRIAVALAAGLSELKTVRSGEVELQDAEGDQLERSGHVELIDDSAERLALEQAEAEERERLEAEQRERDAAAEREKADAADKAAEGKKGKGK